MNFLLHFAIAFGVFLVLDFIWLGFISRKLYDRELKDIKKEKINWTAAVIFYVLYIIGVVFFVVDPAISKESAAFAFGGGALFGLIAYATYDLTNLATMKGFPIKITIIDLLWGTFVTMMVSGLTFLIIG